MAGLGNLIAELRRRRVFRVAAWYAALAWLLIQVAVNTFGPLGLPVWSVRAVIVLLLAGFPVALLLAWAFDIRPDAGTADDTAPAPAVGPTWRSASLWLALAAGVLLALGAQQAWHRVVAPVLHAKPVIAVLPVQSVAADSELANGLHGLLFDELASNPNLVVLARSATSEYANSIVDHQRLQDRLGVDHALHLRLDRRSDRLRIEAELRDAPGGAVVWKAAYARPLGEVLTMQRELADAVAGALELALPPTELRAETDRVDARAVDAFLQGRRALDASGTARGPARRALIEEASAAFASATQLDPSFAPAWALLADTILRLSPNLWETENFEEVIAPARTALVRAEALQPPLFEAAMVRTSLAHLELDDARRVREARRAVQLRPNDSLALGVLADALWGIGDYTSALDIYRQRVQRDPRNLRVWLDLARNQAGFRRYADALATIERALPLAPEDHELLFERALIRFRQDGDLLRFKRELLRLGADQRRLFWSDHHYTCTLLVTGDRAGFAAQLARYPDEGPGPGSDWRGWMLMKLGDPAAGERYVRGALAVLATGEPSDRRPSRQVYIMIGRVMGLAAIGEHEEASTIMRDARQRLDLSRKDNLSVHTRYMMAMMYVALEELEEATKLFELALRDPAGDYLTHPWEAWRYLAVYTRPDAKRLAWEYEPLREVFRRHGVDVDKSIDDYPKD